MTIQIARSVIDGLPNTDADAKEVWPPLDFGWRSLEFAA
jgi:hypothetical protein